MLVNIPRLAKMNKTAMTELAMTAVFGPPDATPRPPPLPAAEEVGERENREGIR